MQFQVPQFVEVEDKIFWSLTLKQFIYLAGGAGISVLIYVLVKPFFLALLLMAPVVAVVLALAFFKYNNRPFVFLLESAAKYVFTTKLYIWRKSEPTQATLDAVQKKKDAELDNLAGFGFTPTLSNSKLKELTWSLDAKDTAVTSKTASQVKK
jgi:hypothetical protein